MLAQSDTCECIYERGHIYVKRCYECRSTKFGKERLVNFIGKNNPLILESYDCEINRENDREENNRYEIESYCYYNNLNGYSNKF